MENTKASDDFDLSVCYRIYPRVSGNPIFDFKDKLALTRLAMESFKEAVGDLKIRMWVLLDNCPPAYAELVKSIFPDTPMDLIPLNGEGNGATFIRQIDILTTQSASKMVYFAEDDYLYLPRSLETALAFLKNNPEVDFLTLPDHPDYHRQYVHRLRFSRHRAEGDYSWRTVGATMLTFMTRRQTLVETADVFNTFNKGNSDLGIWMALTKLRVFNPWFFIRSFGDGMYVPGSQVLAWRHAWRQNIFGKRRTLWAPRPTLATHMESTGIALGADWEHIFGKRAQILKK